VTSSPVYSVLIVEDEYPARMLMTEYIVNCHELKLSGIAENGEKAISMLSEKVYDLVFIDINLPAVSGMEIFKRFSKSKTFFVITTAYSEHAVEAFDLDALDYLLKPFSFERFRKSVDKAIRYLAESSNSEIYSKSIAKESLNTLQIQSDSATHFVPIKEIQFISANNKSSVIHTHDRSFETPKLLKEIEEKLNKTQFVRIHKGFIINLEFVANLRYDKGGAYFIQLKNEDETTLPVGRSYAPVLKELLKL